MEQNISEPAWEFQHSVDGNATRHGTIRQRPFTRMDLRRRLPVDDQLARSDLSVSYIRDLKVDKRSDGRDGVAKRDSFFS